MEKIDYQYLRPKKAEALRKWCEFPVEVRENPEIWQGSGATILPLRRKAAYGLLFGKGGERRKQPADLDPDPGAVLFVLQRVDHHFHACSSPESMPIFCLLYHTRARIAILLPTARVKTA